MLVHKVLEPLNNRLEAVKWGGGGRLIEKVGSCCGRGFCYTGRRWMSLSPHRGQGVHIRLHSELLMMDSNHV